MVIRIRAGIFVDTHGKFSSSNLSFRRKNGKKILTNQKRPLRDILKTIPNEFCFLCLPKAFFADCFLDLLPILNNFYRKYEFEMIWAQSRDYWYDKQNKNG